MLWNFEYERNCERHASWGSLSLTWWLIWRHKCKDICSQETIVTYRQLNCLADALTDLSLEVWAVPLVSTRWVPARKSVAEYTCCGACLFLGVKSQSLRSSKPRTFFFDAWKISYVLWLVQKRPLQTKLS